MTDSPRSKSIAQLGYTFEVYQDEAGKIRIGLMAANVSYPGSSWPASESMIEFSDMRILQSFIATSLQSHFESIRGQATLMDLANEDNEEEIQARLNDDDQGDFVNIGLV